MILDPTRQPLAAAAGGIVWHSKIRIAVGLVVGAATVSLLLAGVTSLAPRWLVAAIGAYLALAGALYLVARHTRDVHPAAIAVMLLADLVLVFALTVVTSRPVSYDRGLIFSLLVVHIAGFNFGRRHAYIVAVGAASAYLAAVAANTSSAVDPIHSFVSAVAFLTVALIVTLHHSTLRRGADKLVALFDAVGQGDFSQEYDVGVGRQPDAIATIGRAYNRLLAQLQSMVLTDPLTGCLNRRGFDQALGREIARSSRSGSELALLAIDLDHFKLLNDRCGHLAGDAILREMGALLRQAARAGDIVARTGGEEFTLVVPDTDAAGAAQLATRLCERIRARAFVVGNRSLRITVSVGVAAAAGGAVDRSGQELKLRADQALYAAKRLGRDRVLTWSE